MIPLLNNLADFIDMESILLGHGQKLLIDFYAMRTRLILKAFSDPRMYCTNQLHCDLAGLIKQRKARWISNIGSDAHGVNQLWSIAVQFSPSAKKMGRFCSLFCGVNWRRARLGLLINQHSRNHGASLIDPSTKSGEA